METTIIVSAISFGLLTGFHCVGMCGPIALSLGIGANNKIKFYLQNTLYQLGRVTTYSLLGAIIGIVGKSFDFAGYQRYISILAGILLIAMVLIPGKTTEIGNNIKWLNKFMIKIKIFLGRFIQRKDNSSRYITGILNGFLPCGAVYAALTSSLVAGGIWQSSLYMVIFGFGTIPMMFLTVVLGNIISINFRTKALKVFPYFLIVIGLLFILRGLELGIPMISPSPNALKINPTGSCCH